MAPAPAAAALGHCAAAPGPADLHARAPDRRAGAAGGEAPPGGGGGGGGWQGTDRGVGVGQGTVGVGVGGWAAGGGGDYRFLDHARVRGPSVGEGNWTAEFFFCPKQR